MSKNDILRKIPKIDDILQQIGTNVDGSKIKRAVRVVVDDIRARVLSDKIDVVPSMQEILEMAQEAALSEVFGLRKVINATGVVLHTNLGRAPLAKSAADYVGQIASEYHNLEYNLKTGRRGSRLEAVEKQLTQLCNCEAALVVNNNAAAVLLALSALCKGGEVIVSRGELVEIGGSFRVPEIISQGGAKLVEVGTTNKTHFDDYEAAFSLNTAAVLKVHTSNFRTIGFTEEVGLAELSKLSEKHSFPLIYDLGGGALIRLSQYEPTVQEALAQGADVLCFSGDKLLGGPQAGIIVGKRRFIETIRKHPLYRALRLDKLSLAALMATLQLYLDENYDEIPTLAMLNAKEHELRNKAELLLAKLDSNLRHFAEIIETNSQAGGGSLPGENFASYAVALSPQKSSLQDLEAALRNNATPIISRIHKEKLLLDVRTIFCDEIDIVAAAVNKILAGGEQH